MLSPYDMMMILAMEGLAIVAELFVLVLLIAYRNWSRY